jgi:hypothetical protein
MEIFETKDKKVITYENGVAQVFDVEGLKQQRSDIQSRIDKDVFPDDKKLLEWAKANYSQVDHTAEKKELERINSILESIK